MFSREDGKILFGPEFDVNKLFDAMATDPKQEVIICMLGAFFHII